MLSKTLRRDRALRAAASACRFQYSCANRRQDLTSDDDTSTIAAVKKHAREGERS
jgi:hypothetical protein